MLAIRDGGLETLPVQQMLADHLADMNATSPAESMHALNLDALRGPGMCFFSAWDGDTVLGCAALKTLNDDDVELKSMRTAEVARGQGIGAAMLQHVIEQARSRGASRMLLETGARDFFAPARRLYQRHGFTPRGPFADYVDDPLACYFELTL